MASQNVLYSGRMVGTALSPVLLSADPRSGGGYAAKPGTWAFDGTYYYQAVGTGVNDWIIADHLANQTDEQWYQTVARSRLGISGGTRLNGWHFDHFDGQGLRARWDVSVGAGGTASDNVLHEATIAGAAATNTYMVTQAISGSANPLIRNTLNDKWWVGMRLRFNTYAATNVYGGYRGSLAGLANFAGPGLYTNGGNFMFANFDAAGAVQILDNDVAMDTSYHVVEFYRDAGVMTARMDGVVVGSTASVSNPFTHAIWAYASGGTATSISLDWVGHAIVGSP